MGKMKELAEAAAELRRCGEMLEGIAEKLTDLFSGPDPEQDAEEKAGQEPETVKKEERTVTKEEVRKLLGIRLKEGYRDQIQELFRKYGGVKLKDIDPSDYAGLLRDAEGLKDA